MKEILLKDYENGAIIGLLTVPKQVSLDTTENEIYKLKNAWHEDDDEGLCLIEYLQEHCPEGWYVELYEDNRDYIEIQEVE